MQIAIEKPIEFLTILKRIMGNGFISKEDITKFISLGKGALINRAAKSSIKNAAIASSAPVCGSLPMQVSSLACEFIMCQERLEIQHGFKLVSLSLLLTLFLLCIAP